ncbi:hypothetical protein [Brucella rhizosphaerae]|nr:hypothetical protein [Brucella rhizosphaerae]
MLNTDVLRKYNNNNEVYSFSDKIGLKQSYNNNENGLLDKKVKRPVLEIAKNITANGDSLYVQMTTKGSSLGAPSISTPDKTPGICGDILPSKIFLAKPHNLKPYTNDIHQTTHASISSERANDVIDKIPMDAVENAFYTAGEIAPEGLIQYKNPFDEWAKKFVLFHK